MTAKTGAIVIKIGGSTLGRHDTTIEDVVSLQRQGKQVVIVHGGGKLITDWLTRQNIPTRFVKGERYTDKASLDVVIAVLAGLVNKEIVASINGLGGKAIGICGVDGGLIRATAKIELGLVGNITAIDPAPLNVLLKSGYIPVIAPIGLEIKEHQPAQSLNINADTVAGEAAAAIGADRLVFLTDVMGVMDKSGAVLGKLSRTEAEALIESGIAAGGMIPKLKACISALRNAQSACIIDGREPHALIREIEQQGNGTIIYGS